MYRIDPDEVNSVEAVDFVFIEIKKRLISLLANKTLNNTEEKLGATLRELAKISSSESFSLWQDIILDVIKMGVKGEGTAEEDGDVRLLNCADSLTSNSVRELVSLFVPLRVLDDTLRCV